MVSSVVKSSSIKFIYENKEDNYWRFYTSKTEHLNKHHHDKLCEYPERHEHHHQHEEKLFLEMKVFVPDVGIVTQKYEVSMAMFKDLSCWLFNIDIET